jgi:hypothetical protein
MTTPPTTQRRPLGRTRNAGGAGVCASGAYAALCLFLIVFPSSGAAAQRSLTRLQAPGSAQHAAKQQSARATRRMKIYISAFNADDQEHQNEPLLNKSGVSILSRAVEEAGRYTHDLDLTVSDWEDRYDIESGNADWRSGSSVKKMESPPDYEIRIDYSHVSSEMVLVRVRLQKSDGTHLFHDRARLDLNDPVLSPLKQLGWRLVEEILKHHHLPSLPRYNLVVPCFLVVGSDKPLMNSLGDAARRRVLETLGTDAVLNLVGSPEHCEQQPEAELYLFGKITVSHAPDAPSESGLLNLDVYREAGQKHIIAGPSLRVCERWDLEYWLNKAKEAAMDLEEQLEGPNFQARMENAVKEEHPR